LVLGDPFSLPWLDGEDKPFVGLGSKESLGDGLECGDASPDADERRIPDDAMLPGRAMARAQQFTRGRDKTIEKVLSSVVVGVGGMDGREGKGGGAA
jgi:hypothetical protein